METSRWLIGSVEVEARAGLCSSAVANPSHGAGVALWVTLRILEVRMRRDELS